MMATFHRIKITDRDGSIIYDDLIYRLPLKEYAVQHKCTEIYILDLKYMLYRKKIWEYPKVCVNLQTDVR